MRKSLQEFMRLLGDESSIKKSPESEIDREARMKELATRIISPKQQMEMDREKLMPDMLGEPEYEKEEDIDPKFKIDIPDTTADKGFVVDIPDTSGDKGFQYKDPTRKIKNRNPLDAIGKGINSPDINALTKEAQDQAKEDQASAISEAMSASNRRNAAMERMLDSSDLKNSQLQQTQLKKKKYK
jgi:hypothetical protein